MSRLFGTDGVRGVANCELTPDLALSIGRAAGLVLAPAGGKVVVGRDTRVSGPMLESALVAGLCSAGARVLLAGVLPTPGIAFLTREEAAQAGGVISASHNPVADNGIKFFSAEGFKVGAEVEDAIEEAMGTAPDLPTGTNVGGTEYLEGGLDRYLDNLLKAVERPLDGLKVVLDCAWGAAWEAAPRAFERAGAEVIVIHAEPDGARINVDCGSTSLEAVAKRVVAEDAALGLGFDGDADRVLAVDEGGAVVDGDRILGLAALHLKEAGRLNRGLIVATVMSNLGLLKALRAHGIEVVAAPVGDRFVAEAMAEHGAVLGGEQSGHVIFGEYSTTGDGVLTGLQVAAIVAAAGAPLSRLAHFFEPYPQVLINVRVERRDDLERAEALWGQVAAAERDLGDDGRVLLRASGTEPLVRVMVEAAEADLAQTTAEGLAEAVKDHLG